MHPLKARGLQISRISATHVLIALSIVIVAMVVAPLLMVAASSLWSAPLIRSSGYLTLQNYVDFLTASDTGALMLTTLRMTVGASIIAVTVGGLLAWIIARTNVPFRRSLRWLPVTPLLMSGLLRDTSWASLYSPRTGIVNLAVMDIFGLENPIVNVYGLGGVIVTMGLTLAPLPYLILLAPLSRLDPSLEEASRASGASAFRTLVRVVIPTLRPALLSGLTLCAIIVATAFETPVILGRPGGVRTFMSAIYNSMSGNPNFSLAASQSMVCLVFLGVLLWWYRRSTKVEARFALVGGRGNQASLVNTGKWRYVLFAFVMLFFLLAFLQLFAVSLFLSMVPYFTVTESGVPPFSLNHYRVALSTVGTASAIRNSLTIAGQAAVLTIISALVLSLISYKTKIRGRRYAELIGTMPLAFPPLVFSVALLLTALSIPALQRFYNTNTLLLVALTVVFLPFALRVISSALISINDELMEASAAAGARLGLTLRKIVIPLLATAFVNAAAIVFIFSFRELAAVALVVPPGKTLLPTQIFTLWQSGSYGAVYALNIISFFVTTAALLTMVVTLKLLKRKGAPGPAQTASTPALPL